MAAEVIGTGLQRASKTSQVIVGASSLSFASWDASCKVKDLATPNFNCWDAGAFGGGQSFDQGISGFMGSDGSFGGDWDAGENPIDPDTIPGLYPRDDLGNLSLVVDRLDATSWDYDFVRVRGVAISCPVEAVVSFKVNNFMNQGPFTLPSGSA
jgi:hypothetical protein